MQEPWRTARAVSYDLSALPGHLLTMDTIIKILVFLIKAHQKLITKTLDKLSIPQLFRKQSPKNPFLTKKKS